VAADPTLGGSAAALPRWPVSGAAAARSRWQAARASIFIVPAWVVILAVVAFPAIYAIYLSFTNYDISLGPQKKYVGLAQYRAVLKDPVFGHALLNTVIFTTIAVNLELILGLALARLITTRIRTRGLWQVLLMVPLMFPAVLAGYQFRWMFNADVGVVNNVLYSVTGSTHLINWLVDYPLGWLSILFAELWIGTPFVAVVLVAGILSVPPEPLEAAEIDGASGWQTFRHVILPLIGPFIWIALALRSLDIGRLYDVIQLMTAGGPAHRTETLWTYVGNEGLSGSFSYASAMSTITAFISILFSGLIFWNLFRARRALS
jgi:multiple sugar transport system permease protein